jgi:multidrug efflux pump subunit AcrB
VSLSTPFIHRPVGTTLLTAAIMLAGALGYAMLPVSPLPQVDFPTIQVTATLPGASPETMASAVATPLERQFGRIAGISEMTSASALGICQITLQFDLNRNINAAARDVQAAINAARGRLPPNLPQNPTYRKVNPADAPIMILALTSDTYTKAEMYDVASTVLQQKLSQVRGVGQVMVWGGAAPGVRIDVNPTIMNHFGVALDDVRMAVANANANRPKGQIADTTRAWSISTTDQLLTAAEYRPLIVTYRNGAASGGGVHHRPQRPALFALAEVLGPDSRRYRALRGQRPHAHHSGIGPRRAGDADHLRGARDPGRVPVFAKRAGDGDSQRGGARLARRHVRRDVSGRIQYRQSVVDGLGHRDGICRR